MEQVEKSNRRDPRLPDAKVSPPEAQTREERSLAQHSVLAVAGTNAVCGVHVTIRARLLTHATSLCVAIARLILQGSPLAAEVGSPVSFAAIGSYAMGSMGTVLVYVRCVRWGADVGASAETAFVRPVRANC